MLLHQHKFRNDFASSFYFIRMKYVLAPTSACNIWKKQGVAGVACVFEYTHIYLHRCDCVVGEQPHIKCLLPATHQCFRRPPKACNTRFVFTVAPSNQAHKILYAFAYKNKCAGKKIVGEVHLQWQQNCQHQQHDNVDSQKCTYVGCL